MNEKCFVDEKGIVRCEEEENKDATIAIQGNKVIKENSKKGGLLYVC